MRNFIRVNRTVIPITITEDLPACHRLVGWTPVHCNYTSGTSPEFSSCCHIRQILNQNMGSLICNEKLGNFLNPKNKKKCKRIKLMHCFIRVRNYCTQREGKCYHLEERNYCFLCRKFTATLA